MNGSADAEGLRLFSVLRGDLIMSEGKANAQAGHAYVDALISSLDHPDHQVRDRARAYAGLRPGTKICLDGGSLADLEKLAAELSFAGIPHVFITDKDHVESPHFDGSPIVTALGVGPIHKSQRTRLLRRLPMWTGGARMHEAANDIPDLLTDLRRKAG